jgi:hypothetical protein
LRKKLKKGGSPIFPSRLKDPVTDHQQLSSAIGAVAISSTHAKSDRSLVFLVPAFGNQVQPPLAVARFYLSTSLPHPTTSGPQLGSTLMLPEMILRLRRGVVNGPSDGASTAEDCCWTRS